MISIQNDGKFNDFFKQKTPSLQKEFIFLFLEKFIF